MKRSLFALLLSLILTLAASPASAPGYYIIKTWKLGGEGGWDYLTIDPDARRLYISRAIKVIVIDADSGKPVGEISDTPGVHGIALAPEIGKGFVSNGRENTVSVFDLKTLNTTRKIKVGDGPDAILYDPATKRVFTFNAHSQDATAIDADKESVVGTIPLGSKPEFAQSDAKGTIFVNMEDKNSLYALDSSQLTVKARWSLPGCEAPTGLAIDREHRRLFSGCDKIMAITDADSGKEVASAPVGDGVDAAGYDQETGLAFASAGEGKLTVVQSEGGDHYRVVEEVTTQRGARTMALDPKTHNVYLVTAQFGPRPTATAQDPHPRPAILADSFVVLVVGK
ncbi:MAG TPA: YncE family protein [Terriglobales bacterium]|nr:YncE family protein [Terriglobales bacterium]